MKTLMGVLGTIIVQFNLFVFQQVDKQESLTILTLFDDPFDHCLLSWEFQDMH